MQKISFTLAKHILEEAKLLLHFYQNTKEEKWGLPQHRSEKIQIDDLFLAFKGTKVDAHDFIPQAIQNGAQCLIVENLEKISSKHSLSWIQVRDARSAWSVLWAYVYKNPEKSMHFYGLTGTDGKTSTVWMASQLMRQNQHDCLALGTLGAYDGHSIEPLDHTTPDPPVFFSMLEKAQKKNIHDVFMEVSSHSLAQGKLYQIEFEAAAFTSFSQDHLDFHKSMDEYWSTKCQLFTKHLKKNGTIIIHHSLLKRFSSLTVHTKNIYSYAYDPEESIQSSNYVPILECKAGDRGQKIRFKMNGHIFEGEIPYLGIHNAENFVAALLLCQNQKLLKHIPSPETWIQLPSIPGRCERVEVNFKAPKIYVDFAHTPEGLQTILKTLREFTKNKLWIVFGCGGDRDQGKRPKMGRIAEQFADKIIVTSDNPRSEHPQNILDDILNGIKNNNKITSILDREKAIEYAIKNASLDDTVLIAGKGHETFQILGDKKIPFSDPLVAKNFLALFWGKK